MKILHTSDWHIGQSLNGYDRTAEFKDFFMRLEGIVAEEMPDVMVVCGDIYDTSMPSTAAQNLYTDSLLHLHGVYPDMQVVITAGNHDSGARLEIARELWGHFGIHIVGGAKRDVGEHIIEIKSREGELKGYVAAVPFVNKFNFPEVNGDIAPSGLCLRPDSDQGYSPNQIRPAGGISPSLKVNRENRTERFFQTLLDRVEERNTQGLPVVLTAHAAVTGGDFSCHEGNGIVIGGEECFPLKVFGESYDYLALGHIHSAQVIPGSGGRARYSGSVIPLNFDETQTHSVTVVEIGGRGRPLQTRVISLPTAVPVWTVPEQPADLEAALDAARALPDNQPAYVRLNVKSKDYLPGNAAQRAVEALEGKQAKYCYIKLTREAPAGEAPARPKLFSAEIKRKSPVEMAKLYYKSEFGSDMDAGLENMLKEVCDAL